MKVITECTISMKSLQTVEEKAHEYVGSIAECKGSGGSSGSGAIDYPDYMEAVHEDWLHGVLPDLITNSVTDIMNSALGNSPWTGQTAYNPDTDITAFEAAITAFAAILAGITDTTNWAALFTQAKTSIATSAPVTSIPDVDAIADIADTADVGGITEARIVDDVDAFANQLDDEINTKVLPRYRGGMRDINAVVSSAFPIGESIIEGFRNREVAKHASALRLSAEYKNVDVDIRNEELHLEVRKTNLSKDIDLEKLSTAIKTANAEVAINGVKASIEDRKMYLEGTSQILRLMLQRISWEESYMKVVTEGKRIKIVAKKEQTDEDMKIDEYDAMWDLEVFQHGSNVLAAISGGVGHHQKVPSQMQSAIGGAMSGAAMGAVISGASSGSIGGPTGMIVGGVLGFASAYL